jgi:hypothetical protein
VENYRDMGMYTSIYVGPVVVIKGPFIKDVKYIQNICSGKNAPKCPYHREGGKVINDNFCSNCGSPAMSKEFYKEENLDWWDIVSDELKEDMESELISWDWCPSHKDDDWLFPNGGYYTSEPNEVDINYDDINISGDMRKFLNKYGSLVERLEEELGFKNIEIEYKVTSYTS